MQCLTRYYPNSLFVSGVTTFGYCYFDLEYQAGLDRCLWLLDQCDEMWVFGDYETSRGCMEEIKFCGEHNIKYYLMEIDCNEGEMNDYNNH